MGLFDNFENVKWLSRILGEEQTIEIIRRNFSKNRSALTSADTVFLYDDDYIEMIRSHPIVEQITANLGINEHQYPAYRYIVDNCPGKNASVLDIGCGFGNFVIALAFKGFCATGVGAGG